MDTERSTELDLRLRSSNNMLCFHLRLFGPSHSEGNPVEVRLRLLRARLQSTEFLRNTLSGFKSSRTCPILALPATHRGDDLSSRGCTELDRVFVPVGSFLGTGGVLHDDDMDPPSPRAPPCRCFGLIGNGESVYWARNSLGDMGLGAGEVSRLDAESLRVSDRPRVIVIISVLILSGVRLRSFNEFRPSRP